MGKNLFFEEQQDLELESTALDDASADAELNTEPLFETGRKRRAGSKRTAMIIVGLAIVLTLICGVVFYIISQNRIAAEIAAQAAAAEEAERIRTELALQQSQEYDRIVNSKFFLEGVTVEGVAIGGKTMSEAEQMLNDLIASRTPSGSLSLTLGDATHAFDLSTIVSTSNLSDVLAQAFQLARSGSVEEVLAEAESIRTNGKAYTLAVQFDFSNIATQVAALAAKIDQPVRNASFGQIDKEQHTVAMVDAQDGVAVDQDALIASITSAIMSGNHNDPIQIPVKSVPATLTKDHLKLITTSATTSFKGSSSNRKYNIRKGADLINGTVLEPGETFSTNGVLGTRTTANGWKMANAYVSGTTEEQAGGGVCQLSSTLYNAVVKADLEIVSRRNHSMPVSYVRKGLDATINSVGNIIDFKFRNDTETNVIIFAWTSGNDLYFKIYRCQFATDAYDEIRLTSEKTDTIYPSGEMVEELDPTLPAGTEQIVVERKNGERWQSYKNYYKNGSLVKTEKLAVSTYNAFAGKKLVGPELTVTPTPTPSIPVITPEPVTPSTPTNTPEPIVTPEPTVTTPPPVLTDEPIIIPPEPGPEAP